MAPRSWFSRPDAVRLTPGRPTPGRRLRLGTVWSRPALLRKLIAVMLLITAAGLALRPQPAAQAGVPVVTAAGQLVAGQSLEESDLRVRHLPAEAVPQGALARPERARGKLVVGPVRAGEPITDARLVGRLGTRQTPAGDDSDRVIVVVRLADPGLRQLLHAGQEVDLVGRTQQAGEPEVVAEQATVVTTKQPRTDGGQVITSGRQAVMALVELPRAQATAAAAASLAAPLAITLRGP